MSRKSSGVAKGGLITGIIGASLAGALTLGGANSEGGSLLGGLFGNKTSAYDKEVANRGQEAITELNIVKEYIMPINQQICGLQAKVAVNDERDAKNQVITGLLFAASEANTQAKFTLAEALDRKNQEVNALLFASAENNTNAKFALADAKLDCCCDKATLNTDAKFALADAKLNCCCDKSELQSAYNFKIERADRDAQLAQAMCGVVKGKPYISFNQISEPLTATSSHVVTRPNSNNFCTRDIDPCDCNQWAW